MFRKKRILILFTVLCLCLGGVFFWQSAAAQSERASAAGKITSEEFKNMIITAYQNYQTEVMLEEYGLYSDTDGEMIASVMEEVLNEVPSLFYVGRGYKRVSLSDTRQLVQINLLYADEYMTDDSVDSEKIAAEIQSIDAATDQIFENINDEMTDVEKAMILHDILLDQIVYDDDVGNDTRLTIVGALLKHSANCQGYSLAYKMLLEKAGISAECISSRKMNHMWNLVQINSKWYHVDLTWDDPLSEKNLDEQYGLILHQNFLLSDTEIKATEHFGYDTGLAVDKTYDNAYWRDVYSGFWYQNGKFVYADTKGIYTRNSLTEGKAKRIKKLVTRCFVKKSAHTFYLISKNRIYQFNLKNKTLKRVYTAPKGSTLIELKYRNNQLYFRYLKNDTIYSKVKKI